MRADDEADGASVRHFLFDEERAGGRVGGDAVRIAPDVGNERHVLPGHGDVARIGLGGAVLAVDVAGD